MVCVAVVLPAGKARGVLRIQRRIPVNVVFFSYTKCNFQIQVRMQFRLDRGVALFGRESERALQYDLNPLLLSPSMALNWTMLSPDRSPVPLPNEMTITNIDKGVEMVLHVPNTPPSETASAGGSGGSKKLQATGKIFVTDQRVGIPPGFVPNKHLLNCVQFIFTSIVDPSFETRAPSLKFESLSGMSPVGAHRASHLIEPRVSTPALDSVDKVRAADVWVELLYIRNQALARRGIDTRNDR